MPRSGIIAIVAMLVATIVLAAAPLASADEGRDRGDHHKCPAGMTCQTARPQTAAPAATLRVETEDRDEDNDIDEDEDENEVDENEPEENELDENEVEDEDATVTPTPATTATASPTPTATASPNATTGRIDLATLQQLIALIRDLFAALAAQLSAS